MYLYCHKNAPEGPKNIAKYLSPSYERNPKLENQSSVDPCNTNTSTNTKSNREESYWLSTKEKLRSVELIYQTKHVELIFELLNLDLNYRTETLNSFFINLIGFDIRDTSKLIGNSKHEWLYTPRCALKITILKVGSEKGMCDFSNVFLISNFSSLLIS